MTRKWLRTTPVARMTIAAVVVASEGPPAAAQQAPPSREMEFTSEVQIPDTGAADLVRPFGGRHVQPLLILLVLGLLPGQEANVEDVGGVEELEQALAQISVDNSRVGHHLASLHSSPRIDQLHHGVSLFRASLVALSLFVHDLAPRDSCKAG